MELSPKKGRNNSVMLILKSNQSSNSTERSAGVFLVLVFSQRFMATLKEKRTITVLLRAHTIGH